jgi:hypothetical protein
MDERKYCGGRARTAEYNKDLGDLVSVHKIGPSIVIVLSAILLTGCASQARIRHGQQPAKGKSTLIGAVLMAADNKPVANATVQLCRDAVLVGCSDQMGSTETDSEGTYCFPDIPPGDYVPAVQISESAVWVLQVKSFTETMPHPVKYSARPDEVVEAKELRLDQIPASHTTAINLLSPIGNMSISDRRPTLSWEAIPIAENYGVFLRRVDNGPEEIQITEHPLELIKNTSIKVPRDLADGIYEWSVYCQIENHPPIKASAFFVVAGTIELFKCSDCLNLWMRNQIDESEQTNARWINDFPAT